MRLQTTSRKRHLRRRRRRRRLCTCRHLHSSSPDTDVVWLWLRGVGVIYHGSVANLAVMFFLSEDQVVEKLVWVGERSWTNTHEPTDVPICLFLLLSYVCTMSSLLWLVFLWSIWYLFLNVVGANPLDSWARALSICCAPRRELKCHCTRLFRTCFVSIWPCHGVFACDVCEDKLRIAIHSRILLSFLGHNT